MQETVITISRQYGSGGRIIARRLAEELGIPYYDKEIIQKVSQETGMTEYYIRQNEFQTTGSFLFDLYGMTQIMSPPDQVFVAQSKAIKGAADPGPVRGLCAGKASRLPEGVRHGAVGGAGGPCPDGVRGRGGQSGGICPAAGPAPRVVLQSFRGSPLGRHEQL